MALVSFPLLPANDPALRGQLAAEMQYFGEANRYAVAPLHTRFDAITWFVWDSQHRLSTQDWHEVIRQADTLDEALRGF